MFPNANEKSRIQMEAILRERLAKAQAEYDTANKECKRLMAVSHDAERPDSSVALGQAFDLKKINMQRYMTVLRQFTDLTVKGKLPDE
jgi:hypothetical protein